MTRDERITNRPDEPSDERSTTPTSPRSEDVRGRQEEAIVNQGGAVVTPPPGPVVSTSEPSRPMSQAAPVQTEIRRGAGLFDQAESQRMRARWTEIQSGFVDEPRRAVKDADALVLDVTTRLTDMFAKERTRLEQQWDRGDNATTEDLRVALQRYHTFFDRLLAV